MLRQMATRVEADLAQRFDHVCCDTFDSFRREAKALTRAGHIKAGGERHEKDDRHRLDDRSRYVLGWNNRAKLKVLRTEQSELRRRLLAIKAEHAVLEIGRAHV